MSDTLSPGAIELIEQPVIGDFSTVDARGRPHVTPVWVDHEGNDVIVNPAKGRAKARHVEGQPAVAMSIVDPEDPYHVVVFTGTVTEISTDGADEHIDRMAKKYLGTDSYPFRRPDEVRIKLRIRPERILNQPEGAAA